MLSFCYKHLNQPQNRVYSLQRAKVLQKENNLEWLKTSIYLVGALQSIQKEKEARLEIWSSFKELVRDADIDEALGKKIIFCTVFAAEVIKDEKKLKKITKKCNSIISKFPSLRTLKTYKKLTKLLKLNSESNQVSLQGSTGRLNNTHFKNFRNSNFKSLPKEQKSKTRSISNFKVKTLPTENHLTMSNFKKTIFEFKPSSLGRNNSGGIRRPQHNQVRIVPSRLSSPNHSSHKTTKNFRPQIPHPNKTLDEIIELKVKESLVEIVKKQEFDSVRKEMLGIQKEALKLEKERLELLRKQTASQRRTERRLVFTNRDRILVGIGARNLNRILKDKLLKIQKLSFQRIRKLTTDREIEGSKFQICINTHEHELSQKEKMDTSIATSNDLQDSSFAKSDKNGASHQLQQDKSNSYFNQLKVEHQPAPILVEHSTNTKQVHSGSGFHNKQSLITKTISNNRNKCKKNPFLTDSQKGFRSKGSRIRLLGLWSVFKRYNLRQVFYPRVQK